MFRRFINRQSADQAVGQEVVRLGSVALVVTTMFLGVSHAGERADYIPACPTEFIKAWNACDPTHPAKMPPLPEKPCLLIGGITLTSAAKKNGGCAANRD
jgi:hypothetical protein